VTFCKYTLIQLSPKRPLPAGGIAFLQGAPGVPCVILHAQTNGFSVRGIRTLPGNDSLRGYPLSGKQTVPSQYA
jgi:hypothetical protein